MNDLIPRDFFREAGRKGGKSRSRLKVRTVRENIKKAHKATRGKKVKRRQLTLKLEA